MTTYYRFVPSNSRAPSFSPIFDGQAYTVTLLWNVSAQRYYVNCQSLLTGLVFMLPLIESIQPLEISGLEWDQINQRVVLETKIPHGLIIGKVLNINVINCIPTTYNGKGLGFALSPTQVAYPMITSPGQATIFGALDLFISMTKGYFLSTFVFRNQTFEVTP